MLTYVDLHKGNVHTPGLQPVTIMFNFQSTIQHLNHSATIISLIGMLLKYTLSS